MALAPLKRDVKELNKEILKIKQVVVFYGNGGAAVKALRRSGNYQKGDERILEGEEKRRGSLHSMLLVKNMGSGK